MAAFGSRAPTVALVLVIGFTAVGGAARRVDAADAVDPPPAIAAIGLPDDRSLAGDASLTVDDAVPPIPAGTTTPDLERLLGTATDRLAELDPADWRLDRLVEALAYDPMAAFAFVRDRIDLDATAGVLRGPEGTLGARAGGSADRALLLRALLDTMLVPTRLAVTELDDAAADQVLARALEAPGTDMPAADPDRDVPVDLQAVEARARRDHARLRTALGDRLGGIGGADLAAARDAVRHHVWVQALIGTGWVDLDPTFHDAAPGAPVAPPTETMDALPDDQRQAVRVRVEADVLSGGTIDTIEALDESIDAAAAARGEIWLTFQPELGGLGGSITEALTGASSWVPWLIVDGEPRTGRAIPIHSARDILSTDDDTADGTQLLALRLVIGRTGPGLPETSETRTLLDRGRPADPSASDAARSLPPLVEDDAGPAVFRVLHHILVGNGSSSPYVATMRQIMATDLVWRMVSEGTGVEGYDLADALYPGAVADEGLQLAAELVALPALTVDGTVRAWVSRPRVTVLSTDLATDGDGPAVVTDLVFDDPAVVPLADAPADAAAKAEIWYGVLEGAVETEFVRGMAIGQADTITTISTLMSGPVTLLGPGDAATEPDLPPELRTALERGLLAIVPGDPAAAIGWWTIDPVDGTTRSVGRGGEGWGTMGPRHGTGAPPGQQKPWGGQKVWDLSGEKPARPAGAPRGPCRGAGEYSTIIGCVSLPGAIAFYGGLGIAVVVGVWYLNSLWKQWLGYD